MERGKDVMLAMVLIVDVVLLEDALKLSVMMIEEWIV